MYLFIPVQNWRFGFKDIKSRVGSMPVERAELGLLIIGLKIIVLSGADRL
jgi:hypothetical protein